MIVPGFRHTRPRSLRAVNQRRSNVAVTYCTPNDLGLCLAAVSQFDQIKLEMTPTILHNVVHSI